ncbi:hypothetical protein TNCV_4693621 [Trichonephila clavipes]|uniref:Uncharacterized protein n=1 Tax=Trichonephila clavipes TaxID=2585209 RepID=A0A8X7BHN0_TRICX|nr:hypothetical protein TNCV_4693621 [Trichonephila clavipes]
MRAMDRNNPIPFSSARLVCYLSDSDALARKDALWSYTSHVGPASTPRREQHLSTLQATQSIEILDGVLSSPKWEKDYSVILLPPFFRLIFMPRLELLNLHKF